MPCQTWYWHIHTCFTQNDLRQSHNMTMLSSCVGLTRRDYNMMQISDFRTVMNCLHLRGQFNVAFTLADHPSNQSSRPVTAEFIQTTTSRLSGVNFPKFAKSGSKCPFCKEIFWWDSRAHGKRHPELCLIGAYGLTAHILHCPPPNNGDYIRPWNRINPVNCQF